MEALLSESSADVPATAGNQLPLETLTNSSFYGRLNLYSSLQFCVLQVYTAPFEVDPGYSWNVNGIRLAVGRQFLATVSLVLVFLHVSISGSAHFQPTMDSPTRWFHVTWKTICLLADYAFFSVAGIVADSCDQPR